MRAYLLAFLMLLGCGTLAAQPSAPTNFQSTVSIGLAWDASPSPEVTSYKIYWGSAPRTYTNSAVRDTAELTYRVEALGYGVWYFAVTALDDAENESDFSNEVSIAVLPSAPTNLGSVQGPFISDLTSTSVRMSWKTSTPTTTRIEYSYPNGVFSSLVVDTQPVTDHYVRLTGLSGGKLYSYEVYNTDSQGNVEVASGTFRTR